MNSSFPTTQPRASCLLLSLACLVLVPISWSAAQTLTPSPQTTLVEFYHWYIESLDRHRNPLSDEPEKIEQYVSKKLIQHIDKLSSSPEGLDEDYFLKSQDILEDWPAHIVVSEVRMKGKSASAIVTLGATKESKHRLILDLVQEGNSWKISKVR